MSSSGGHRACRVHRSRAGRLIAALAVVQAAGWDTSAPVQAAPEAVISWEYDQLEVDSASWAGSDDARIRVLASDGFDTGAAESAAFRVTRKSPRVSIGIPANDAEIGAYAAIVLSGHADDLEDGELSGASLTWSSDRQGVLGNGSELILPGLSLEPGRHVIALTASDSEGTEGSAEIAVRVAAPLLCVGDLSRRPVGDHQ